MWLFFLAMIINVIDRSRWARFSWSTRKWRFRCLAIGAGFLFVMVFVRAMAHVLFYALLLCSLLLDLYLVSCWHRGVPKVVGVVLKTPGLRYSTIILCEVSFIFAKYLNGTLQKLGIT